MRSRRLRVTGAALTLFIACSAAACSSVGGTVASTGASKSSSNGSDVYANDIIVLGASWFTRMNVGFQRFAQEHHVKAPMDGPNTVDPSQQVQQVQNLIATKPAAIGVDPIAPSTLDPVLAQARRDGITVVGTEGASLKNVNVDIEGFDNKLYGAAMMDTLAKCMHYSGKYISFVGNLTSPTHMAWASAELARAKAKYPKISRIGGVVASNDSETTAYQRTKQLLAAHPDVKGFLGSGSLDVVGVAQAIEEAGLTGKICVVGTSLPDLADKYLKSGAITDIYFWDPAAVGQAMDQAAYMINHGQTIKAGTNLGATGYTSLTQDPSNPKVFWGNKWIVVNKKNLSQYPF